MPRLRSFAIISLLIAAAATSGHAAMNRTRPAPLNPAPVDRTADERSGPTYITDISGKKVRLVGPRFMADPGGHHLMINGKPERVDQQ
ncbi:hypothetical protein [Oryzifoliimicrobium ureilyticus]|uniref:hypothetical protein n=1 Tax=Oryzifoliimicrobium ureilyticus TaxID=3113724 RepID=UPI0030761241